MLSTRRKKHVERKKKLTSCEVVVSVTVGVLNTVATCTAAPLDSANDETTAVSEPVVGSGDDVKVTVRDVADVTATVLGTVLPPRSSATVVDDGDDVSKPVPAITSDVAAVERDAALAVTVGSLRTVATCTAVPLEPPPLVTIAVKAPVLVGSCESVSVSAVVVAEVTTPAAPLESVTRLFAGLAASKLVPVTIRVVLVMSWVVVVSVTVGGTAGGGGGGGGGGPGGDGPGGDGGVPPGTKTSPMGCVRGTPVAESTGSAARGAEMTPKVPEERPRPGPEVIA